MRTSSRQARKFSSTLGRIAMALVFASMIGAMSIAPAFARDGHGGGRGHYEHGRRGYGGYYAPVYAPPPVVYAPDPYQSPGISLVFPIHIR